MALGLPPLTIRDAAANNIAEALDFSGKAKMNAPTYEVQQGFFGEPCATIPIPDKWNSLQQLATEFGFPLP